MTQLAQYSLCCTAFDLVFDSISCITGDDFLVSESMVVGDPIDCHGSLVHSIGIVHSEAVLICHGFARN